MTGAKKILLVCFVLFTGLSAASAQTPTPTPAGIDSICTQVVNVGVGQGRNILHKSQASGHLAATGRARSCSLIYGSGNYSYPSLRKLRIYDSLGGELPNSFYAYELGGCPFPARYYTGVKGQSCARLQATLMARQGTREAYIKIANNKCLHLSDLRGRQGSVVNSKAICRRVPRKFYGEG